MSRWVFLRGWARESRHWERFPEVFRRELPDAEVTAPDLPGNGTLHRERSAIAIAGMADHARARMPVAQAHGPFHLLGLSMGGMACIAWATRHPQEVAALVLVNTSVRPFSAAHRRLRPRIYPAILRVLLERDERQRQALVARLTTRDSASDAALVERWAGWSRQYPLTRANALRQLLAAARFRAARDAPRCPVLVLASARDALVDPDCSRRLATAWGARLAIHPDAGHDLTLDDPEWVAAQVRAWLRRS